MRYEGEVVAEKLNGLLKHDEPDNVWERPVNKVVSQSPLKVQMIV